MSTSRTAQRLVSMDRLRPGRRAPVASLAAAVVVLVAGLSAAHAQSRAGAPGSDEFYLAVVTGDDVYVRSGGGDSYYPFGKLHKGDVVKVIGEKHNWARVRTTGPAFKDFFAYIRYPKSDAGRFRLEDSGRKGRALGLTRALAPNLNTNYEPNDSWKRILLIETDTVVDVLETTEGERAIVHKIVMPPDAEGWISTAFLEPASARDISAWQAAVERSTLRASGALQARALDTRTLDPSALDPGALDPSALDPSALEPSALEPGTVVEAEAIVPPLGAAGPGWEPPTPAEARDEMVSALAREEQTVPAMPEPLEEIAPAATETFDDLPVETTIESTIESTFEAAAVDLPPVAQTPVDETMITEEQWTPPAEVIDEPAVEISGTMIEWPVRSSPVYEETVPTDVAEVAEADAWQDVPYTTELEFEVADELQATVEYEPTAMLPPETYTTPQRPSQQRSTQQRSTHDRIAEAIRSKPPKAALADLEDAYQRLQQEPIETAEVLPLRHLYSTLARVSTDDRPVARYAEARAEQLTIWADLQQRRAELDQLRRRLELTVEETSAIQLAIETSGAYAAVGRLVASTIYDGIRLPRLYRVQDAVTGRTIAYLRPDAAFDMPAMLGQVIGVIGRPVYEDELRLKLVDPKRIDLLGAG